MITIKLKYKSSTPYFQKFLGKLRQQFSCVYRYSYNRLYDGLSKIDIYHQISAGVSGNPERHKTCCLLQDAVGI